MAAPTPWREQQQWAARPVFVNTAVAVADAHGAGGPHQQQLQHAQQSQVAPAFRMPPQQHQQQKQLFADASSHQQQYEQLRQQTPAHQQELIRHAQLQQQQFQQHLQMHQLKQQQQQRQQQWNSTAKANAFVGDTQHQQQIVQNAQIQQPQHQQQRQPSLQFQRAYQFLDSKMRAPANSPGDNSSSSTNSNAQQRSTAVIQPGVAIVPPHYPRDQIPIEMPALPRLDPPPFRQAAFVHSRDGYTGSGSGGYPGSEYAQSRMGANVQSPVLPQPATMTTANAARVTFAPFAPFGASLGEWTTLPFTDYSNSSDSVSADNQFGKPSWSREQHYSAASSAIDPSFSVQQQAAPPSNIFSSGPHRVLLTQQQPSRQQQEQYNTVTMDIATTLFSLHSPVNSPRWSKDAGSNPVPGSGSNSNSSAKLWLQPQSRGATTAKKPSIEVVSSHLAELLNMSVEQQNYELSLAADASLEDDFLNGLVQQQQQQRRHHHQQQEAVPQQFTTGYFAPNGHMNTVRVRSNGAASMATVAPHSGNSPGNASTAVAKEPKKRAPAKRKLQAKDASTIPTARATTITRAGERKVTMPMSVLATISSADGWVVPEHEAKMKKIAKAQAGATTKGKKKSEANAPAAAAAGVNAAASATVTARKAPVKRRKKQGAVVQQSSNQPQQHAIPPASTAQQLTGQHVASPYLSAPGLARMPGGQLNGYSLAAAMSLRPLPSAMRNLMNPVEDGGAAEDRQELVPPAKNGGYAPIAAGGLSSFYQPESAVQEKKKQVSVPLKQPKAKQLSRKRASAPNAAAAAGARPKNSRKRKSDGASAGSQPLMSAGMALDAMLSASSSNDVLQTRPADRKPQDAVKEVESAIQADASTTMSNNRSFSSSNRANSANASADSAARARPPHHGVQGQPTHATTSASVKGFAAPFAGYSGYDPVTGIHMAAPTLRGDQADGSGAEVSAASSLLEQIQASSVPLVSEPNNTIMIFCKRDFMRYQAVKLWKKYQEKKKKMEFQSVQVLGKRTRFVNARYGEQQQAKSQKKTRTAKKTSSRKAKHAESTESLESQRAPLQSPDEVQRSSVDCVGQARSNQDNDSTDAPANELHPANEAENGVVVISGEQKPQDATLDVVVNRHKQARCTMVTEDEAPSEAVSGVLRLEKPAAATPREHTSPETPLHPAQAVLQVKQRATLVVTAGAGSPETLVDSATPSAAEVELPSIVVAEPKVSSSVSATAESSSAMRTEEASRVAPIDEASVVAPSEPSQVEELAVGVASTEQTPSGMSAEPVAIVTQDDHPVITIEPSSAVPGGEEGSRAMVAEEDPAVAPAKAASVAISNEQHSEIEMLGVVGEPFDQAPSAMSTEEVSADATVAPCVFRAERTSVGDPIKESPCEMPADTGAPSALQSEQHGIAAFTEEAPSKPHADQVAQCVTQPEQLATVAVDAPTTVARAKTRSVGASEEAPRVTTIYEASVAFFGTSVVTASEQSQPEVLVAETEHASSVIPTDLSPLVAEAELSAVAVFVEAASPGTPPHEPSASSEPPSDQPTLLLQCKDAERVIAAEEAPGVGLTKEVSAETSSDHQQAEAEQFVSVVAAASAEGTAGVAAEPAPSVAHDEEPAVVPATAEDTSPGAPTNQTPSVHQTEQLGTVDVPVETFIVAASAEVSSAMEADDEVSQVAPADEATGVVSREQSQAPNNAAAVAAATESEASSAMSHSGEADSEAPSALPCEQAPSTILNKDSPRATPAVAASFELPTDDVIKTMVTALEKILHTTMSTEQAPGNNAEVVEQVQSAMPLPDALNSSAALAEEAPIDEVESVAQPNTNELQPPDCSPSDGVEVVAVEQRLSDEAVCVSQTPEYEMIPLEEEEEEYELIPIVSAKTLFEHAASAQAMVTQQQQQQLPEAQPPVDCASEGSLSSCEVTSLEQTPSSEADKQPDDTLIGAEEQPHEIPPVETTQTDETKPDDHFQRDTTEDLLQPAVISVAESHDAKLPAEQQPEPPREDVALASLLGVE